MVAFALGTFSRRSGFSENSAFQHALVLSLREILQERVGTIDCFVQDPAYTGVDKELLGRLAFQVVDNPKGFLHVDDRSIVVSCSPNQPIRQIVTELARPAVMIWDKVGHLADPQYPR
jgi:hypothetical protein